MSSAVDPLPCFRWWSTSACSEDARRSAGIRREDEQEDTSRQRSERRVRDAVVKVRRQQCGRSVSTLSADQRIG